ncbi:hypothetical protein V5799_011412 [Amblyomma americanum]|uniref:Uncharacterized protein n=1 Tax=Amblyomma americanum TaxID=6943 RepID=A0AAQ4EGZ4_AMBAM
MLYNKRFFPYYISNILAGLDEEGKGCIYCYDPVGHCERVQYRAGGSSSALLQPLLDNQASNWQFLYSCLLHCCDIEWKFALIPSQIGFKNMENVELVPPTRERAVSIIKDVFISAAERDIYTGDSVVINVIDKNGIKEEMLALRRD